MLEAPKSKRIHLFERMKADRIGEEVAKVCSVFVNLNKEKVKEKVLQGPMLAACRGNSRMMQMSLLTSS